MQQKLSFLFLFSILIASIACKKVDVQFGNDFLDNSNTRIIKVDTFMPQVSTVYLDSFVTSAKGTALIGGYTDPVFGTIKSESYLEVAPPGINGTADFYDNTTYDSLTLFLKLNKTYYGDTTKALTLQVNRLSDSIVPPNNGISFYNNNSFAASTLLGSKTVTISPSRTDSVVLRLNDGLGAELMRMLKNKNSDTLKQSSIFINFFRGLKLSAAGNPGVIYGFSDSITMRLHYSKPGLFLSHLIASFTLANQAHQFNNITVNRTGTVLSSLSATNKELASNLPGLGNAAYLQTITGVMTKIRFPSIAEILKAPNYTKILRAELIVKPVQGSYDRGLYVLPPALRLTTTNTLNELGTDLTALSATGAAVVQTGNLSIDYLYGENTSYIYDVTNYIKFAISDATQRSNGLLLTPPSPAFQTSFNRVILGSSANSAKNKIELQIYYAAVQ